MKEEEKIDYSILYTKLSPDFKMNCPKCKNGIVRPHNPKNIKVPSKFHNFDCDKCDFHFHYDPVIDIE